ncbi:MAG TPA: folate-binding protein, partial [Verrucomicrobiae bacterium]|nr:folate-binding protein [Verrucomicrobiae bacterium]
RMKHRGTARKRIFGVHADATLPPAGAKIASDGTEIGEIVSTYGSEGFALIRLDRLEEAKASLTVNTMPLTIIKPKWLKA